MIYIASDHAGFNLKQESIVHFPEKKWEFTDLGPYTLDPGDDYPLYAKKVCTSVLENPGSFGVLICDTGVGMYIAANRFKGIRAALLIDEFYAVRSREHNNANIAVFAAEDGKSEKLLSLLEIFLQHPFSSEERHARRVQEIDTVS